MDLWSADYLPPGNPPRNIRCEEPCLSGCRTRVAGWGGAGGWGEGHWGGLAEEDQGVPCARALICLSFLHPTHVSVAAIGLGLRVKR